MPVVEQFDEVRMQGDVAVVVEFADRDPQPPAVVDLHYRVAGQGAQFADPDAGAGQQMHDAGGATGLGSA